MTFQKLRKVGNSFVVTIPPDEIERQNLQIGEMVAIDIRRVEIRPVLPDKLKDAFEESWREHEDVYRDLAKR